MLKIGPYTIANPYILAPMAGVSQMPFRRLALQMGAGLAPTELISAKGLFFGNLRTKTYLTYDAKIEKPFVVQLFGGEPESMAIAADQAMAMGANIIDINMGCPVKKVTKTNAGSALMCDWRRAQDIIQAMLKATTYQVPITAKIRSGWDQDNLNYLEVARALEDSGLAAIAIHPRTRAQAYSGQANWQHIADLKASLKIPVIGNGDVMSLSDARAMQAQTGCNAVMIGRAALGNPWIFRELVLGHKVVVSPEERLAILLTHLDDHLELSMSSGLSMTMAIKSFRSHLMWYSKGLAGGAGFRQLVMSSEEYHKTKDIINEFFIMSKKSHHQTDSCDYGIDYRQAFG